MTVNIRNIQHYMYCPRRYALIEINKDWNQNAFVVKADLMHERVHSGNHDFSDKRKVVRSSVSIYNDLPEYDLYGITDCVEFVKSNSGVEIAALDGKYNVRLIEYKPRAPKGEQFNETDAIQVFAQKICADYVWKCDCEAFLYYSDIRKRVKLPFNEQYEKYDNMLRLFLGKMREILENTEIPAKNKGQKCSGCSFSDLCFPKNKKYCVKDIINTMKGENLL